MSTIEELTYWHEATQYYQKGDLKNALELMRQVGPYAKVMFNIGMIYLQTNDHESSEIMFSQSIQQDEYLCIGYLQKGYCLFMLDDYDIALKCFTFALQLLLNNDFIDYAQLGLNHKLYRCELLYNMAICHEQMGNDREYDRLVREASNCAKTNDHRSLIEGGRRGRDLQIFFLRSNLFQVPASKVMNLKKKEFLKEAKVIMNDSKDETFVGFSGANLLEPVLESVGNTLVRKKSEPLPSFGTIGRGIERSNTMPIQRSKSIPEEMGRSQTMKPRNVQDILPKEPLKEFNDSREREREQFDLDRRPSERLERRQKPNSAGHSRNQSDGAIGMGGRKNSKPSNSGKRLLARKSSLPSRKYETDKDVPPVPSSPRLQRRDSPRDLSPRDRELSSPRDREPPSRAREISRTDSPTDSGYEENKTKLKIHTESSTVAMFVNPGISLSQLTRLVADKLKLDDAYYGRNIEDGVKLSFVDQEDPDTMISLVDDDDLDIALDNNRGVVHLYLNDGDVLDLY